MKEFFQEYRSRPWPKLEVPTLNRPQILALVIFVAALITGGWLIWFSGTIHAEYFVFLGLAVPVLFLLKNRYLTIVGLLSFQIIIAFLFVGNQEYPLFAVALLIGAIIAFELPMLIYSFLVFSLWVGLTSIGVTTVLRMEVGIGAALFVGWFFKEKLTPKAESISIKFPEAKVAIVYLLWATLGYALWCYDRQVLGWEQYKRIIADVVFFIITPYVISTGRKLNWAILAWISMGIFASVATLMFPSLSEPTAAETARSDWGAAASTFQSHKNWISSLIALSFFVILARAYWAKYIIVKVFLYFSLILVVATIFYQQSRGTLVGLVVAAVIFWLADTFFSSRKKKALGLIVRIFLLLTLLTFVLISVFLLDLAELYGTYAELFGDPMEVNTMQSREQVWTLTADMIIGENHLIRGLGPGAFWALGTEYGISSYIGTDVEEYRAMHPHCLYLDIYLHLGVVGLVAFLWLAVSILKKLWMGFRTFKSKKFRYLSLGLFASLISFYLHGFIEFQYHNILTFWAFLGFALAAYHVGVKYDTEEIL